MLEQAWQRWLEAVPKRVSRRHFEPAKISAGVLDRLATVCDGFRPFGPARTELVREAPEGLYRGIIGAYGSIRGASHCLVMIGPEGSAAEVGYVGEAAVLEATALGLGTCWVGGLFNPATASQMIALSPGERVFAVSPVGRVPREKGLDERLMVAVARSRTRETLETRGSGVRSWPEWARSGLEAARLAASAVNRQPWRFSMEDDNVILTQDTEQDTYRIPKRLDCGIAMFHFELGARSAGITGAWLPENSPRVAVFVPRRG